MYTQFTGIAASVKSVFFTDASLHMFFLMQFSVIADRDAETPAEIQLRAALYACITGRLQS